MACGPFPQFGLLDKFEHLSDTRPYVIRFRKGWSQMQGADKKAAKSATASDPNRSTGFTDAERAAMRARAQEQKAEARADKSRADGESAVRAAIAAMTERDHAMAERIHAIVTTSAPELAPKTWYGMPAYARDSKVVCFFKCAQKFNTRYATFGFSDVATLDDGALWPVEFALTELTAAAEARIAALVKKAVS
jgi:uncharacterized protein YdhG (YjbR/CyaY superfamily)